MSTLDAVPPQPHELLADPPAPEPSLLAVGPHMGHLLLFFVVTALVVLGTQFGSLAVIHQLHIYGRHSFIGDAQRLQGDTRWLVASEALAYAVVALVAAPVFRALWHRPFAVGVHWNVAALRRNAGKLVLTGLACGIGIGLLGTMLPMPKNPPILGDIMRSSVGAWLMFLFGVSGAPLFEELFFRGFLLPAFVNAFRWLSLKGDLSPRAALWVGVPVSVVLTSLPFALLHAQQVSHAWAPVLLIGLVSVVLCVVRLRLNSLACSTLVHSSYNFFLFAGLLVQTGGFRHMDKLAH